MVLAWSPWVIMAAFLVVSGFLQAAGEERRPLDLGVVKSFYVEPVPTLHNEVERAYQLQKLAPATSVPVAGGAETSP